MCQLIKNRVLGVIYVVISQVLQVIKETADKSYFTSRGYLYTIYNLKDTGDGLVDNRIFVYDMNGSYTTKDKLKCYQKMHTITINPDGKPDNVVYTKMEIESACLDKDGKLLLCGNFGRANDNYDDMIIRVKGFDPANPTPN